MAAAPYGVDPVAAAAASAVAAGWATTEALDTATSKKHPAEFTVLTRSIVRSVSGAGSAFRDYPSIQAMGAGGAPGIVIGFDTEFVGADDLDPQRGWVGESEQVARRVISYQFAAFDPTDDTRLRLAVVLPHEYPGPVGVRVARLSFERALELAITGLGLHEHPLALGWTDRGVPASDCVDAKGVRRPSTWFRKGGPSRALPLTLVGHFQHADLTTFVDKRKAINTWNSAYPGRARKVTERAGFDSRRARWLDNGAPDILRAVISASAGMVSPKPVRLVLDGDNWRWKRPVEVSIRDTMAQSGAASLKVLGDSIGVPKLDVPGDFISRMDDYLDEHPVEFLEYAANDAVIALEYVTALYGADRSFPLSLPTGAAAMMRRHITGQLCGDGVELLHSDVLGTSSATFNSVFGGLTKVDKTVDATTSHENELAYYRKRELVPLDGASATWSHACALSFRGGYNMCSEIGFFPQETHDFDLMSCYPTSSATILDVDFLAEGGVISKTVNNYALSLDDFTEHGPLTPFVGFVSFEFPESIAYPCLPVPLDGSVVYPRTSGGARGVWATGPEVWLALTLGAEVRCQIGHFARVRRVGEEPSMLLRGAYKQLLDDRARAKAEFGAKSFEQTVLKLMANSPYGKLAQGVMGQSGWDAWAQERDDVGGSAITSPYHATMTTGLVRAVLLATLNQLYDLGYSTPSCTTDGFITDAPLDVVDKLDLFGLAELWRDSRDALTGSRQMWERKHHQSDLLNITTRANFSREPHGVLAHGGYKLPEGIVEDSQEDRDLMWELMVTRTGALPVRMKVFPSVQELTRTENRLDFAPKIVDKQLTIEFDRKRRPVRDDMTAHLVEVGDDVYEVAHVRTVPWENAQEAMLGRSVDKGLKRFDKDLGEVVWERSPVRRTREQWLDYFERLEGLLDEDGQASEAERLDRISKGIVIAHRQGVINIPWLDSSAPLAERLDAFESFGLPRPKERFWSHARSKVERQIEVELDEIAPYVEEMLSVDPFVEEGDV
ncbi:DNA-directed DNA polymerase [Schaalia hyovaginalis]|nr:DNA-directed DNA polymerase [Schaalia hyovaginalis]